MNPKLTEDDIDIEKAQRAHSFLESLSTIIRGPPEPQISNQNQNDNTFDLNLQNQSSLEMQEEQQSIRQNVVIPGFSSLNILQKQSSNPSRVDDSNILSLSVSMNQSEDRSPFHNIVFEYETPKNQDISPSFNRQNTKLNKIIEEYDENSPPKKPKMSPRKLRFNKRSFSLPKREAKRLFTSLMIIDTQIEHENSSSLRSRSNENGRNLFNSKGGRSMFDDDDKQSTYSQNSSYYNFENMRSNLRKINRDSVFSKSSERSQIFQQAARKHPLLPRGKSQTQSGNRLPPASSKPFLVEALPLNIHTNLPPAATAVPSFRNCKLVEQSDSAETDPKNQKQQEDYIEPERITLQLNIEKKSEKSCYRKSKTLKETLNREPVSPQEIKKIIAFYGKYSKTFIDESEKKKPGPGFFQDVKQLDTMNDESDVLGNSTDSESPEIKHLKENRSRRLGRKAVDRKQKSFDNLNRSRQTTKNLRSPFNDKRLQELDSKKISGYKQNLESLYKDLNQSKTLSKSIKVNFDAPAKSKRVLKQEEEQSLYNPAILSISTSRKILKPQEAIRGKNQFSMMQSSLAQHKKKVLTQIKQTQNFQKLFCRSTTEDSPFIEINFNSFGQKIENQKKMIKRRQNV